MSDLEAYEQAKQRIVDNPELQPFEKVLLYDWDGSGAHWRWVATAPISEILEWAKEMRPPK